MHATGVELYHTIFIRQPAVSHTRIVGIELDDIHAGDRGVQRIFTGLDQFQGAIAAVDTAVRAVVARNHDRLRPRLRPQGANHGQRSRTYNGGAPAEGRMAHLR